MLPSWAPNLHPVLVHFPIVLLIAAVTADGLDVTLGRPSWLASAASGLYVVGAVSAGVTFWTGLHAAAEVFVPGMAHPLIADHRAWALTTTLVAAVVAVARAWAHVAGGLRRRGAARIGLVVAGLCLLFLVQQTAERGARLVYEQGVGVVAPAGTQE